MFLDYRHSSSQTTDVTFNLKDFKALLVLCEGLGANVAICFDQPGSPLLVHPVFHSNNPLVRLLRETASGAAQMLIWSSGLTQAMRCLPMNLQPLKDSISSALHLVCFPA